MPTSSPLILAETVQPASINSGTPVITTANSSLWIVGAVGLSFILIVLGVVTKIKFNQKQQAIANLQQSNDQLQEELSTVNEKLEASTQNPDLHFAHSILLDYIRMRMDEEVFHYLVINQIRTGVTDLIGASLRRTVEIPEESRSSTSSNLQIDHALDITYEIEIADGKWSSGVLFRLDLKLRELPIQSSSNTVNQMLECIEVFLSHSIQQPRWTSDLQGRLITLAWDEKTKPIPLLCLEQLEAKKAKEKSRSFIGKAL
ncbi:MAG: hypothetical protein ACRC6M_06260 [Microcystaceae cyanobacterium]